jgi:hypothetical protein
MLWLSSSFTMCWPIADGVLEHDQVERNKLADEFKFMHSNILHSSPYNGCWDEF